MTTSTSQHFEALLRAELARAGQVPAQRTALEITNEPDILDRTLSAANRDLAAAGFEISGRKLREVRVALNRLREGVYGECQYCGNEISARRLRAVPWANLCITCQENAERGKAAEALATAA
jgi:DnaK suppressor protein